MEKMIEQTQKLIADEMKWWTDHLTETGEQIRTEGDRVLKLGRETFDRAVGQQATLASECGKHLAAIAERQIRFFTEAFQPPKS